MRRVAGKQASRGGWRVGVGVLLGAALAWGGVAVPEADARMALGGGTLSGNLETQNILRVRDIDQVSFVQQRNTLRLEIDYELIDYYSGNFAFGNFKVPFVESAKFFTYYRLVYDTIYDIAPGPFQRAQDGSRDRNIGDIPGNPTDLALENVIREIYFDLSLRDLPVRLRIGRQQIVWGNTTNFRALDSVHALDLTWHWTQEAGILGRVGFTELRRPAWALRMNVNLGNLAPGASNAYIDAWDIPFDYNQTKLRFLPAPWSAPSRDPFRGGQDLDVGAALGSPLPILVQPCFDFTGSTLSNADADPDFSDTAETGACNAEGRQVTSFGRGLYDNRDPLENNQFGIRFGATGPYQVNYTLNYMYRRTIFDISGTAAAKVHSGLVGENPTDFVQLAPHSIVDPATGEQNDVLGFLRIPVEYYHPFVHVFGFSADYFERFTSSVWNFEFAYTLDNPTATRDPSPEAAAIRDADTIFSAVNVERPTWIKALNKSRTVDFTFQVNLAWLPGHEDIVVGPDGEIIDGDVGSPPNTTIPGQFRDEASFDQLKEAEILTVLIANTTYWGGTLIPAVAWVSDWTTAPTHEWIFILQYLPNPWMIIEPQARIFWTNGHTVDDRFSIGRQRGRSELLLKATYQF